MSLLTKVTATALALISFTAPAFADNSFAAHEALVQTIRDTGVEVYLNTPPQVCGDNIDGAYISGVDALVICQDNGTVGGPQVAWTDNDLDTLRHEAQHLVQDCVAFRQGDMTLVLCWVMTPTLSSSLSISSVRKMEWIAQVYRQRGADQDTIILEFEAFAVAAGVDASDIAAAITVFCEVMNDNWIYSDERMEPVQSVFNSLHELWGSSYRNCTL